MARPALATIRVATPDRLLSAAEEIFARDGLADARLQDIAHKAGITRASLLYHFDSKEQLHDAVVDRALDALGEILASAMGADGDFLVRGCFILEGFFTFVDVHPHLARIVVREVVAGRKQIVDRALPLIDAVVDFLVREGTEKDAAVVRHKLMMVVSDAFLRTATGAVGTPLWGDGSHARAAAELLLLGLCADDGGIQ
jgi:AcrR family transcriptional regulator